MKRPTEQDVICNQHNYILTRAKDILKIKSSDYDNIEDLLWFVQDAADDIYSVAELAYDAGQRMENRLKEYRDAIEGLGFMREK